MITRKSSTPTPGAQFSVFLSRFPLEIIALVKQCLPKLRSAVLCSHEIVYDYANSIVVTFGMSERGYEGIVSIAIFPDVVRLYFNKDLPDPKGLLEGSGMAKPTACLMHRWPFVVGFAALNPTYVLALP